MSAAERVVPTSALDSTAANSANPAAAVSARLSRRWIPERFIEANLFPLAFEFGETMVLECNVRTDGVARGLRHQNARSTLGGAFDPARGVHGVADNSIVLTVLGRADETDHGLAAVEANADVEVLAVRAHLLAECQ